jgi:hypothetical protein
MTYGSLESVIEQSKEGYYLSLRRTQGTIRTDAPDWNPWLEFFLRALQSQKQRIEKKMERVIWRAKDDHDLLTGPGANGSSQWKADCSKGSTVLDEKT